MLAVGLLGPRPVTLSRSSSDSGTLVDVPSFLVWNCPHAQFLEMVPFRPIMRKLGFSLLPGICKADQPLQGQSCVQGGMGEPPVDLILLLPTPMHGTTRAE